MNNVKKVTGMTIMIKPASGACNLRCKYCFYADEMKNRTQPFLGYMSEETLEILVKKVMERVSREAVFVFQGGEPTLAGLDFFRKLIEFQNKYAPASVTVRNSIQTNGILLDEEWCRFLKANEFLVGISLDGTKYLHDRFRVDRQGEGTWLKVMRVIERLKKHEISYNVLTVVNSSNARKIRKIYDYFLKNDIVYQQYILCLEPLENGEEKTEYGLTPNEYGEFLKNLFDLWYLDWKKGKYIYIRQFENLVGMCMGCVPESCNMRGVCSRHFVVEADGGVYPCDFYVLDQWKLGNIRDHSFEEIEIRRDQLEFVQISAQHPEECRTCKWYSVCRNGCRREREHSLEGMPGKNMYCEGYKSFLEYAWPRLQEMALKY